MSDKHTGDPYDYEERINREMVFHLSVKEGLSETTDPELWARAAGAARGLLKAKGCFSGLRSKDSPQEGIDRLEEEIEDHIEQYKTGDEPIILAPDDTIEEEMSKGFLWGLKRAWDLSNGEAEHFAETYGPIENRYHRKI